MLGLEKDGWGRHGQPPSDATSASQMHKSRKAGWAEPLGPSARPACAAVLALAGRFPWRTSPHLGRRPRAAGPEQAEALGPQTALPSHRRSPLVMRVEATVRRPGRIRVPRLALVGRDGHTKSPRDGHTKSPRDRGVRQAQRFTETSRLCRRSSPGPRETRRASGDLDWRLLVGTQEGHVGDADEGPLLTGPEPDDGALLGDL